MRETNVIDRSAKVKAPKKSSANKPKAKGNPTTKKTAASTSQPGAQKGESQQATPLPFPVQQKLLDVFERSFTKLFQPADDPSPEAATGDNGAGTEASGLVLTPLLREQKAALFARDFAAAFENARPELLEAYAARWSPTRALGYAGVLAGLGDHLEGVLQAQDPATSDAAAADDARKHLKVAAIGGCAAEVAALAGFLHVRNKSSKTRDTTQLSGAITLLDSAPWGTVVAMLQDNLTTPPPLSSYASEAARASNAALIEPHDLTSKFVKHNVLSLSQEQLAAHLGTSLNSGDRASQQPILVTLFFTLNELYTTGGIGKTTAFLLNLGAVLPFGSLLLVVDSPGSYSEATLGKESKRYPMHWLLDHSLLKRVRKEGEEGCTWEKLESDESTWFRLSESLRYPIQLENMRYQMHLYRATKP